MEKKIKLPIYKCKFAYNSIIVTGSMNIGYDFLTSNAFEDNELKDFIFNNRIAMRIDKNVNKRGDVTYILSGYFTNELAMEYKLRFL